MSSVAQPRHAVATRGEDAQGQEGDTKLALDGRIVVLLYSHRDRAFYGNGGASRVGGVAVSIGSVDPVYGFSTAEHLRPAETQPSQGKWSVILPPPRDCDRDEHRTGV